MKKTKKKTKIKNRRRTSVFASEEAEKHLNRILENVAESNLTENEKLLVAEITNEIRNGEINVEVETNEEGKKKKKNCFKLFYINNTHTHTHNRRSH